MKTRLTRFTLLCLAALLFGLAPNADAQVTDAIQLHGFGGWAVGFTDNENRYGNIASEDGEWNNYYFALNVAAQPTEKLSVHAQMFWGDDLRGQQLELDFAFAQWTHSPGLQIRAGKVLSPLGLYTETFDVGTLRPFYLLPQSIYGGGGTVSKSYLGAGISGSFVSDSDWEVSYDLFGGEMRFLDYEIDTAVGFDPETMMPVWSEITFTPIGRGLIGGKLTVAPPLAGLELGASYANMESYASIEGGPRVQQENYGLRGGRDDLVYLQAQYDRGGFSLKAEQAWKWSAGNDLARGYAETAYRFAAGWQLAASYEWLSIGFPEDSGVGEGIRESSWAEHNAFGVALNYWVGTSFVLKANYYHVKGNFHARPEFSLQRAIAGTLDDKTNVFIVGTQFSF